MHMNHYTRWNYG